MAQVIRYPTGTGSVDTWTASSGGNKWEDVDDPAGAPDDNTTYIARTGSNGAQQFTMANGSVPGGSTINFVRLVWRLIRNAGANQTIGRIRVNTTDYSGASQAATTSYADYTEDWATNPATTAAWTVDEANGTAGSNALSECGLNTATLAGAEEQRRTLLHILIDYTAGATGHPALRRFVRDRCGLYLPTFRPVEIGRTGVVVNRNRFLIVS